MKYTKSSITTGAWVKSSEVESESKCKLVSETKPQQGEYGTQDVAKIRFQDEEGESRNVRLNKPTINALVDAFGDDSANWQGNLLTAHTEKMRVAGKAVVALYLIPEGYEIGDDESGYLVITKIGGETITGAEEKDNSASATVVNYPTEDIDPNDIPF